MSRPRKHNPGLPTGVYLKRGTYWRVIRGKWFRLGKTMEDVERGLRSEIVLKRHYQHEAESLTRRALIRARVNARGRRKIPFTITVADVMSLLEKANWRCAVSGLPFSSEPVNGRLPYAPSIDRINNSKGYEPGNCRVVCVLVNLAMNTFGEEALWHVFAKKEHRVLDVRPARLAKQPQVVDKSQQITATDTSALPTETCTNRMI